jgi:TPR repeat protein
MYLGGLNGVSQDRNKAEFWFGKSAEKRHRLAIKELEGLR